MDQAMPRNCKSNGCKQRLVYGSEPAHSHCCPVGLLWFGVWVRRVRNSNSSEGVWEKGEKLAINQQQQQRGQRTRRHPVWMNGPAGGQQQQQQQH